MSNVYGPPESPSIADGEPSPPRISSAQLAALVTRRFARARYSPPPPQKTNIVRVVANPPKAFSSPPEAVTSPPKLESDDVRSFDG